MMSIIKHNLKLLLMALFAFAFVLIPFKAEAKYLEDFESYDDGTELKGVGEWEDSDYDRAQVQEVSDLQGGHTKTAGLDSYGHSGFAELWLGTPYDNFEYMNFDFYKPNNDSDCEAFSGFFQPKGETGERIAKIGISQDCSTVYLKGLDTQGDATSYTLKTDLKKDKWYNIEIKKNDSLEAYARINESEWIGPVYGYGSYGTDNKKLSGLRLTSTASSKSSWLYIDNITYTHEANTTSFDPTETSNETEKYIWAEKVNWDSNHVNYLSKTWQEHTETATDTYAVDFGIELNGQTRRSENWDSLKLTWKNATGTIIATSTELIENIYTENNLRTDLLAGDWTSKFENWGITFNTDNVDIYDDFYIQKNYYGWNEGNYTLETEIWNSASSTGTTTQTWSLNLNHNQPEIQESEKEATEDQFERVGQGLERLGVFSFIDKWRSRIKQKFPFSWIYKTKEIWNSEMEEEQEGGDPPKLTWNTPAIGDHWATTTVTLVDIEGAQEQYPNFFDTFRDIFAYALWLSTLLMVFFRTKKFLFKQTN